MTRARTLRNLFLGAVGAGLFLHGAGSAAHTSVKLQAYEGKTEDNALKIGHGCETADAKMVPVIAQSVLYPVDAPDLSASDGSPVASLDEVIAQGSLAGLFDSIQDASLFGAQGEKRDALGNATGFWSRDGRLRTNFRGRVPFQFTAPSFVPESCAKRLLVKIAVADICNIGRPTVAAGKLNLWIPDNGSQLAAAGKTAGIDGIGAPATLTVNRDLVANPLSPECGAGIDVTVTPSAAAVDAGLGIPGFWKP